MNGRRVSATSELRYGPLSCHRCHSVRGVCLSEVSHIRQGNRLGGLLGSRPRAVVRVRYVSTMPSSVFRDTVRLTNRSEHSYCGSTTTRVHLVLAGLPNVSEGDDWFEGT